MKKVGKGKWGGWKIDSEENPRIGDRKEKKTINDKEKP